MAKHSSILPGKFYGQRSLAGPSPWGHKESDATEHTHTSKSFPLPYLFIYRSSTYLTIYLSILIRTLKIRYNFFANF